MFRITLTTNYYSHTHTHTHTHPLIVPTAPLNFAMEPTSDSSQLTASWQQPTPSNGVITGYTVYCTIVSTMDESPSEDNFAVFALLTSANLGVMINDLQPFTYYQCFVSANTNVGKGPGSNRNTTRTIQDGEYIYITTVQTGFKCPRFSRLRMTRIVQA